MKLMQPFMIISDFETYTDWSGIILPYSFAMCTHCMCDVNKNKVPTSTGENILDKVFENWKLHVKHIDEIKSEPNPHSNPDVYDSNPEFATCLICNKIIDDQ